MRRAALVVAGALAISAVSPAASDAQQRTPQQEISESQRRLQQIREERSQLRRELQNIRGQVHDISAEIRNIQRQSAASSQVLRELTFQLEQTEAQIASTETELIETRLELGEKKALLDRRVRDIYKRGPLQTAQVLLAAESFSDLINRYKYLYLVARRDRQLMREVAELHRQLGLRQQELRRSYADLQFLQTEREQEHQQLEGLRTDRGRTLTTLQRHERTASARLETLARDERRMTSLITTLEARRREAERRERERLAAERERARTAPAGTRAATPPPAAPRAAAPTLTTADVGNLNWPVGGRLLYRFGRQQQPNGTTIRWNGVGIGAAAGSPVTVVESGTVEMAGPFEGYGPTVVVSHGGGYYSLYLYLREIQVRQGATVTRGQTIGTVGGEGTPEGAHIEFQIREPGGEAVDPLTWLRRQAQ